MFVLMDATPTRRVTRWAELHSISARDLAHHMGDDPRTAYMRAWRLLTGRVAWTLDTIRQALGCFSERLGRRVTFEESFGMTDDEGSELRDNEP